MRERWVRRARGAMAGVAGLCAVAIGFRPLTSTLHHWLEPEPYCAGVPRDESSPRLAIAAWSEGCEHHPKVVRGPYPALYPANSYGGVTYPELVEVTVSGNGQMRFLIVGRRRAGGDWRVLGQGTGP